MKDSKGFQAEVRGVFIFCACERSLENCNQFFVGTDLFGYWVVSGQIN